MKVFKFAKWWWRNLEYALKAVICVISYVVAFLLSMIFFGATGILTFVSISMAVFLFFILYHAVLYVMNKWKDYNTFYEYEQQEVINRLRGSIDKNTHFM